MMTSKCCVYTRNIRFKYQWRLVISFLCTMVLFQVEKYSILHHLQTFTVARPLTPYTNSNIVISEIHRSNIELTCELLKLLISSFVCYVAYMFLFILLCGDIHPNPGPISRQNIKIDTNLLSETTNQRC